MNVGAADLDVRQASTASATLQSDVPGLYVRTATRNYLSVAVGVPALLRELLRTLAQPWSVHAPAINSA